MHVWINGPFGVGKSSTADELERQRAGCRHFDAEQIGYMLVANLRGIPLRDFQDLPAWRRLVPTVAREVAAFTGQALVIVQSVLNRDYWSELSEGLRVNDLPSLRVVLDADPGTLRRRIEADDVVAAKIAAGLIDAEGVRWRLDHIDAYVAARRWLHAEADLVVNTAELSIGDVAEQILAVLPPAWAAQPTSSRD